MVVTFIGECSQRVAGAETAKTEIYWCGDLGTEGAGTNFNMEASKVIHTLEGEIERLEGENAKLQSLYQLFWEKWAVVSQSRKQFARELSSMRKRVKSYRKTKVDSGGFGSYRFVNTNLDLSSDEDIFDLNMDFQEIESPFRSFESPPPREAVTTGNCSKLLPDDDNASTSPEPKSSIWDTEGSEDIRSPTPFVSHPLVADPFASFKEETPSPRKRPSKGIQIPNNSKQDELSSEEKEDKTSPSNLFKYRTSDELENNDSGMQKEWFFDYTKIGLDSSVKLDSNETNNQEEESFVELSVSHSSYHDMLPCNEKCISLLIEHSALSYQFYEPVLTELVMADNVTICVEPDLTQLEKQLVVSLTYEKEQEELQDQQNKLCIQSPVSQLSIKIKHPPKRLKSVNNKSTSTKGTKFKREIVKVGRSRVDEVVRLSKKILPSSSSEDCLFSTGKENPKSHSTCHYSERHRRQQLKQSNPEPKYIRKSVNNVPKGSASSERKLYNRGNRVADGINSSRDSRSYRNVNATNTIQQNIGCQRIVQSRGLGSCSVKKRFMQEVSTLSDDAKVRHRYNMPKCSKPKRVSFKHDGALPQQPSTVYRQETASSKDRRKEPQMQFIKKLQRNTSRDNVFLKYPRRSVDNKNPTKKKHAELERKLERESCKMTLLSNHRQVNYAENVLAQAETDGYIDLPCPSADRHPNNKTWNRKPCYNQREGQSQFRNSGTKPCIVISQGEIVLNPLDFTTREQLQTNDSYKSYPDRDKRYEAKSRYIRFPPQRYRYVRDRRDHVKIGKLNIWQETGNRSSRRRIFSEFILR